MRGHERLIRQRMRGVVPAHGVLMHLAPLPGRIPQFGADEAEREGIVEVEVDPRDRVDDLDLRCLVGLRVAVIDWTENDDALRGLVDAVVKAGAREAMGFGRYPEMHEVVAHKGWSWQA